MRTWVDTGSKAHVRWVRPEPEESGRPLDAEKLPEEGAVSVVTLAELHAGVLAATDVEVRARRLAAVAAVSDIELVPLDEDAALMWARMRSTSPSPAGGRALMIFGSPRARHRGSCRSSRRTTTSPPSRGVAGLRVVRV